MLLLYLTDAAIPVNQKSKSEIKNHLYLSRMFAVLYTYHVKSGEEKAFVKSWTALTKLIIKLDDSHGSRLHFTAPGIYMAYALWKDEESWKNFGKSLPASSKKHSQIMKDSCSRIKTSHTMDVIEDLLISIDEK